MNSFLISYDLITPGKDYDKIAKKIENYPNSKRILESVWIVNSNETSQQIAQGLKSVTDNNDKIFVVKLESTISCKESYQQLLRINGFVSFRNSLQSVATKKEIN
ncbi:CRISPR-associated protein Cas2 [Bacillus cereus group sp. BfR-BA-01347]|uniref:CRISPR-associated protein Cas2 n=1 Tax=Bacillus cereus group sp. BfR-BA-01347 TaxID=2920310 RepID=UPI001F585DE0|nr:CRISPR-associated protein Cas2 [Bacillus cereus group sp. BfR-BA-01347]